MSPIAIPATGALMGTAASISARLVPHTTVAIELEPLDSVTSETHANDVGKVVHVRHDGLNCPLGELPVSDLPSSRSHHPPRLADAEWRKVVVQHEGLAPLALDGVDDLCIAGGAERGGHDGLRLAACEQGRAVSAREEFHAGADIAHRGRDRGRRCVVRRQEPSRERWTSRALRAPRPPPSRGHCASSLAGERLDCRVTHLGDAVTALHLVDDTVRLPDGGLCARSDRFDEGFVGRLEGSSPTSACPPRRRAPRSRRSRSASARGRT